MEEFTSYRVGVAAEALAAALFARCGYDVSVQYGANQPEYDLMVALHDQIVKISVKGSKDGAWGLTQSLMGGTKTADYHGAADEWLRRHSRRTALCFVQFKNVAVDEMPRVYLATPKEVAERLKATAKGRGDTILYERKLWTTRAHAAGTTDEIPPTWRFSPGRVAEIFRTLA